MNLPKIYSEVCAILETLGSEYINRIPSEIYQYMLSQKDNNLQIYYDVNKSIDEQEMSKETVIFIAYLNLQYWCSEDEKQELLKIYKQNDEELEQELRETYNLDKLFKNKQNQQQTQKIQETQLVENKSKSYIKILIKKVINIICFWKSN